MQASRYFEYEEENGFMIQRGDKEYWVYGTAEACYTNVWTKPTRDDPGCGDMTQEEFSITEMTICDEDGNEVDLVLTDHERSLFEDHMSAELDDLADNYDLWEECSKEEDAEHRYFLYGDD